MSTVVWCWMEFNRYRIKTPYRLKMLVFVANKEPQRFLSEAVRIGGDGMLIIISQPVAITASQQTTILTADHFCDQIVCLSEVCTGRFLSLSLSMKKGPRSYESQAQIMVETVGVEPTSKSISGRLSPSAAGYLILHDERHTADSHHAIP